MAVEILTGPYTVHLDYTNFIVMKVFFLLALMITCSLLQTRTGYQFTYTIDNIQTLDLEWLRV